MKSRRRPQLLPLILLLLSVLSGSNGEIRLVRVTREAADRSNKASDIPLGDSGGLLGRLFGSGLDGIQSPGVNPSFGVHFGGIPGIGGGGGGGLGSLFGGGGYGGGYGGGFQQNNNPLGLDVGPVSVNPFVGLRVSKLDGRPIITPSLDLLVSPNAQGANLIDTLKHGVKNLLSPSGPSHGGYYPPGYQSGHQGGLYQQGGYSPSYTPSFAPPYAPQQPSYPPPRPAYNTPYVPPQPVYHPKPAYQPPRPVAPYVPPQPVYHPKPAYQSPRPVAPPVYTKPAYYPPQPTYTYTTKPPVQEHYHKHEHTHTHTHHNVGGFTAPRPTSFHDFSNYARLKDDKSSIIKRTDSRPTSQSVNRSGFVPSSGPLRNPLLRDAIGSRVEFTRSGVTRNNFASASSNPSVTSSNSPSSPIEFKFPQP